MTGTKKRAFAMTLLAVALAGACSSGNAESACSITGSYKVHYSTHTGSAAICVAPADATQDLTPHPGLDAGASSCAIQDPAACTLTAGPNCKFDNGGITESTTGSITFARDGSSGTGTLEIKNTNDADGATLSDCTYDMTYTRL